MLRRNSSPPKPWRRTGVNVALKIARRELRAGVSGFRLFLACLALGVAAIAGVGSLARAVTDGLATEARAMLGGDVALRAVHRPVETAQREFLQRKGTLSEAVALRSMARLGDARTLVEMKAVDGAYPLYGVVGLEPAQDIQAALAQRERRLGRGRRRNPARPARRQDRRPGQGRRRRIRAARAHPARARSVRRHVGLPARAAIHGVDREPRRHRARADRKPRLLPRAASPAAGHRRRRRGSTGSMRSSRARPGPSACPTPPRPR